MHRLYLYHRFRLTVVGTGPRGVSGTSGDLLDGRETGRPDGDFVTTVSAADLVLTPAEQKDKHLLEQIKTLAVTHPGLAHLVPAAAPRPGR
jgi:hypothetical protein